ncbi:MAG: hypothetical protein GWN62_04115 [Aliifodinibius sp.]|nr:hypothetical protein [Fodinibius sp.]
MKKHKWALVTSLNDPIQAEILRGLLEAQGITIHIVREGYQAAMGIANQASVRIEILARDDQVAEAKQIINDYNAGKFYQDDAD